MTICPTCGIGRQRYVKVPFIFWVDGEPAMVPQVPSLSCDVCGETHHDPDFVYWLEMLINSRPVRTEEPSPVGRAVKRRPVTGGAQGGMRKLGS